MGEENPPPRGRKKGSSPSETDIDTTRAAQDHHREKKLSSTTQASPGGSVVIVLAIFILLIIRRIYRSYRGVRFSAARTIGYAVFYVAFGSFFSIISFLEGVPAYFALPYGAVLVASAVWSYRFTDRRISFWKGQDGSVYFKGGVLLYLIYVFGLIARLSIEFTFFGSNLFVISPGISLTSTELYATVATDLLLMFGLGLLVGRNARVVRRYRDIEAGKEALPDSPQPYEPIFERGEPKTTQSSIT